jgi:hypothetical protein
VRVAKSRVGAAAVVAGMAVAVLAAPAASPASADTFDVTSTSCTGPGSLVEAVNKANSTPGADTIEFKAGLVVDADGCPDELLTGDEAWIAQVTDDLTIEGNGATLKGKNGWVTTNGADTPLSRCPDTGFRGDVLYAQTPGLFRVGDRLTDNSNLKVEIKNLKLFELEAIAQLYNAASLTLDGVTAERIFSSRACNRSAIEVTSPLINPPPTIGDSKVVLKNNLWKFVVNWDYVSAISPIGHIGAISGKGMLAIENSQFFQVGTGGFISWNDGDVSIVSSRMDVAGGIVRFPGADGSTRVVNSLWIPGNPSGAVREGDRLVNGARGPMTFTASTILLANSIKTNDRPPQGLAYILHAAGAGNIEFKGTAIGVNNLRDDTPGLVLGNDPQSTTGGFSADPYVWIQPVLGQGATELNTLFGSTVLTDAPGLATQDPIASNLQLATPLLGTSGNPGKLLDVISDSECTSGGAKGLLNPIDGSCITKDVLGNPRFDGNGFRNIGAIQLTLAPSLQVTGTGDGTVDLAWTRPKDPSSGAITGYAVFYRPAGSAGAPQRVNVSGPDTLTRQISGLTNGTEYEFQVVAVNTTGDGPLSNTATGTPFATPGTPAPSATPGDGQVQVSWPEPSSGGHPGPATYAVVYRPVGTAAWTAGPANLSARTTTIPGLVNGTTYEFGVFATWGDGTASELGTTRAAPAAPATPTPTPTPTPTTSASPSATASPSVSASPSAAALGTGGDLAGTGTNAGRLVPIGVALLVAGSLALLAGKRRGLAGKRQI